MAERTASPAGACGSGVRDHDVRRGCRARSPSARTTFGTLLGAGAPASLQRDHDRLQLVRPGAAALDLELTEAAHHAFAVEH